MRSEGRVRVGTSGWIYKHWKGVVYPAGLPVRRWLAHYATLFDTVEVNNSFYRLPSEETFREWARQAPPGFRFAVRASRYLTHMKKLKDPEGPLDLFLGRARWLGEHLGPVDERASEPLHDFIGVLFELDLHDGLDGLTGALGVDDGRVSLDQPGVLELPDAPGTRSGREAHLLGQIRHADAPVPLQDIQDSSIRLVELHNWRI